MIDRHLYYKLGPNNEVLPATPEEGSELFNSDKRIIQKTQVNGALVSTVFLVLDHGHGMSPPLVFETMVFDCACGEEHARRYQTYELALRGHMAVVQEVLKEGT